MPVSITVEGLTVVLRTKESVGGDELVAAAREFFGSRDEAFRTYRSWLSDYRDVRVHSMETRHLLEIADLCRQAAEENPDLVVAIVADADLKYGLSRMFQSLADDTGWELRVFRSMEEARSWLDDVTKEP